MHIVRNSEPMVLAYNVTVPPGEWLMQDDTAFNAAARAARGTVGLRHWVTPGFGDARPDDYPDQLQPRSILLIRSGAIGDLLLLTPCIKGLRAKYPNAEITLCCYAKHFPIIAGAMTTALAYPPSLQATHQFDLIIPLENVIELATEQGIHATDAYAQVLGVGVSDYHPVYHVLDTEKEQAEAAFPRMVDGATWRPRVGLQIHPSSAVRAWPMQNWNVLVKTLVDRGWEVMLLGSRDGIKSGLPQIKDCSTLSFRDAAAVLATCRVFCGADSSFFNLCPALDVPAIGIFGPVDWRTRVREGSGQFALAGAGDCAPCGWTNSRGGRQWPQGMPCEKAGHCVPMAQISPERVAAKIDAYRCKSA